MQSRSLLFLLALCTCAHVAAAAAAAVPHPPIRAASASQVMLKPGVTAEDPAPSPKAQGDVLIRAADTRESPPRAQPIAAVARAPTETAPAEQPPRRAGTAMLLTAVAVMVAIALRRIGGAGQ
jgi:hypothetical protein